MNTARIALAVSVAALSLAGLTACSDSPSTSSSASSGVAPRAAAPASDVAFAQSMIPHHQQAVEMAGLALAGRSEASDGVRQLAKQIREGQGPEIAQMTMLLQRWGAPAVMPGAGSAEQMPGMDHGGHDMGGMTVAGMMSATQMDRLEGASGRRFDDLWLAMMIEHHRGALAMAQQVRSSSEDTEVLALADRIISAQQAEISTMENQRGGGAQ